MTPYQVIQVAREVTSTRLLVASGVSHMHLRWECETVTKLLAFARIFELAESSQNLRPRCNTDDRVRTQN